MQNDLPTGEKFKKLVVDKSFKAYKKIDSTTTLEEARNEKKTINK
jgi:hypothetical protein